MKKHLLLLFIVLAGFGNLVSQTNADCINAIQLCSTPSFTFNATVNNGNINELPGTTSISNPGTNVNPPNDGCLHNGENNPQWLIITMGNAGLLEFVFGAGNSLHPQSGFYDWAMWPYNAATCAGIQNNTLPPIRCNWNASNAGGTGIASAANIPPNGAAGNYEAPLAVNACDQFMICISNFSGVNTLVSFLSLGTASLSCNPSCNNYNLCAGNSATIVAVNYANLSNPTYSLVPGNLTNNTGTFVVTPSSTTNYTTYISGLNGQSTTQTISAVTGVVVNPQPSVAPTVTQTSCSSSTNAVNLHFSINPPGSTYTVSWNFVPSGFTSNTTTSVTGGSISQGPYSATVTATGGCSAVANFTINPPAAPANFTLIPLTSTYTVTCSHPNVVVDASNTSFNYTWTNGSSAPQTDSEALFNATTLGNWTVTATNPVSGCIQSHTFSVIQNTVTPTGTVTPVLQNVTCLSGVQTVSLSASPTVNVSHHIYSPQNIVYSVVSHTALYGPGGGPGVYKDTIRDDQNGCYVVKTFTITSSDNFPVLSVTSLNNFTVGCNTHSTTTINITGDTQPTGGGVTYTILPPSFPGGPVNPGSQSTYTFSTPGTYTALIRATVGSCETKVQFSVVQDIQGPDIHASVPTPVLSCDSMSTVLTAITSNSNVLFSWSYPDHTTGAPVTVINPTVPVLTTSSVNSSSAGNYTLTLLNNTNGCTSTTVVAMKQNLFPPIPVIGFGSSNHSVTCSTQTIQLTNNSSTGIPLAAGFPTNQIVAASLWQGPSPQAPVALSANYVGSVPGTYTLTVKDFNNGCTSQATISIADNRIYPVVKPLLPFIIDCGSPLTIRDSVDGIVSVKHVWLPPFNAPVGIAAGNSLAGIQQAGLYRVTVTNTLNGCATLGTYTVVNGKLNSNFVSSVNSGFAPLTVTFANNTFSGIDSIGTHNTQSITTVWAFGNCTTLTTTPTSATWGYCNGTTSTSAVSTPTALYTQPGNYPVTIYSFKGSCSDTAIRYIHVDIPSKLEIPNVFTPNGDGVNDIFFLKVANLKEINALIYDRWGHKVYELVSSTGNIAWDGMTETGKEAASGVYFYVIKATGKDGQGYDTKGTITLFR